MIILANNVLPEFGAIGFNGKLRPSQVAAVSVIEPQLDIQGKHLHIVAPPGSGKTVLGLYVWANLVRKPTLVLSPNSAIQAQWAARTDLFDLDGKEEFISTDPKKPGLLTSLTYQSITMPKRGGNELNEAAIELWIENLIANEEAIDEENALGWIEDLKIKNSDYYEDRISVYRKKVRDEFSKHGNALWTLSESAKNNLQRLKEIGIGMIILDECHHLLHHWGRVLTEVREYFDDPIVLGLTATPPDFQHYQEEDAKRYQEFFGEIDYEVPVPALVRDSNLAPYQDLAFFVRPSQNELNYVAQVDDEFKVLLDDLFEEQDYDNAVLPLDKWVFKALDERITPGGKKENWDNFSKRNDAFANAGRTFLLNTIGSIPEGVPYPPEYLLNSYQNKLAILRPVLDRYVRYGLRRSESEIDHEKAELVTQRLRMLGTQITETGIRPCASPVGRIMAYASSKTRAISTILSSEMQALGGDIRAVIITDFEKTSATTLVEGVMDDEAGGAVAAFRQAVQCDNVDLLNPILMTGSTVLVDDDLAAEFLAAANDWINERNLAITLVDEIRGNYHEIVGKGKDWIPRYYSLMITEFFQLGITKCLIGTRGLLGEGWDASRINVLIDLTTVTTSMSINQLRGRSIRLDKQWPEKVANNWDVICLAEEFTNGFSDYERFKKKHKQLYGVCDDGAIEKGVGHVHAAFTEAEPEGVSEGMSLFNEDMLRRSRNRSHVRGLWGIGQPFHANPTSAVEAKLGGGGAGGFKFGKEKSTWTDESLVQAVSLSIVNSLIHLGMISRNCRADGGDRGGGWVRLHLEHATQEESALFAACLEEILGPMQKPRYVISRSSKFITDTWLSKIMPEVIAKFFRPVKERLVMYHTVPKVLAASAEKAEIFQRYWNEFVSPSELFYARSKEGKMRVEIIKSSTMVPKNSLHRKEIFL
ncbi:MAG: DEAD/DEAH box helicase family protein [Candidatus Poseidoniaceae archaeon]